MYTGFGWVGYPTISQYEGLVKPYHLVYELRMFYQMVRCKIVMNPMGSQIRKELPTKTNPSCRQQGLQGRMIIDHRKDESQLLWLEFFAKQQKMGKECFASSFFFRFVGWKGLNGTCFLQKRWPWGFCETNIPSSPTIMQTNGNKKSPTTIHQEEE